MNSIRDGQFKLNEFIMIDATAKTADCGKALQLTPVCVKANIYESVLSPTVRADFEFYDSKGMFDNFLFKNKKIIIEFTTNESNSKSAIRYEFYVQNDDPVVPTADDKGVAYKLSCTTYEVWKSRNLRDAPLSKKKIECEKMVKAYLNVLGSNKNLFAEKTRGLHAFDLTLKTPLQCIDEIRVEYAMSQEFKGHAFYFFENKYGFVFKSMEMMIREGKENIGDKCFMQSTLTNLDFEGAKWRNILAFKSIQNGNQGIAKVIVQERNTVTREITTYSVDPKKLEFETLNEKSISSTLKRQNQLEENASLLVKIDRDPTIENAERAEKKNHVPIYMAHFLTTIAQITIYGDSTITVGDVIHCQLPEYNARTQGDKNPIREDSAMTSGNYMVTKCRHVLTFNEKAEYMQGLEIVKDGIGGTPRVHK